MENPDIDTLYTSKVENEFMKKVIDLIDKNISNTNYGRNELASDLCMTYISAYRKFKALTGQSPAEFIRNYRIKKAGIMLRSTITPINEIAEKVGFTTPSHFSESFAKEYGISPSDYRRQAQDNNNNEQNSENRN